MLILNKVLVSAQKKVIRRSIISIDSLFFTPVTVRFPDEFSIDFYITKNSG